MKSKKILIVDDEKIIRWMLSQKMRDWGFVPVEASTVQSALALFDRHQPELTLLDINLPDGSGLDVLRTIRQQQSEAKVIIITATELIEHSIVALRLGVCDFITKPINLEELYQTITLTLNTSEQNGNSLQVLPTSPNEYSFERIIGKSPKMKEIIALARKIAEKDVSSLLLQGESGTGKDLLAKAIHYSSAHANKPFVSINCAAIPSNLLENELFGHEKGSYTDAKSQKAGLFEQAKGGTIFLDEIGDLEIGLQAKLLRVLEDGKFRRVGGLIDLPLNAFIIAASNRDLRKESEMGIFRQDLYFRLAIIELTIPPLRERGDDILTLARYFIKKLDRSRFKLKPRELSPEVIKIFKNYEWSGNIRELKNAIERLLILEESEQITAKYLPAKLLSASNNFSKQSENFVFALPEKGISLEALESSLIRQALHLSRGNITRAGELLQISRDKMRYRIKKNNSENSI